jgi:hypothetical protein
MTSYENHTDNVTYLNKLILAQMSAFLGHLPSIITVFLAP